MNEMPLVLVVDDDPGVAGVVQIYLQREACVVRRVPDGAACLESVRREKPDLIIMDVMMPRMDGHTAAAALAEDPETRGIPIVMLTAKRGMNDPSLLPSNVVAFIEKPFDGEHFLATVRYALRRG